MSVQWGGDGRAEMRQLGIRETDDRPAEDPAALLALAEQWLASRGKARAMSPHQRSVAREAAGQLLRALDVRPSP